MSRRFKDLVLRATRVRAFLYQERQRLNPSPLKMVRIQRLQILIADRLQQLARSRAIRRASAPRFVPVLASNGGVSRPNDRRRYTN